MILKGSKAAANWGPGRGTSHYIHNFSGMKDPLNKFQTVCGAPCRPLFRKGCMHSTSPVLKYTIPFIQLFFFTLAHFT